MSRKGAVAAASGACLLALAGLAPAALRAAGHHLDAPAQVPARADLIVVLGGDLSPRGRKAAELYAAGYAPLLLLTGFEPGLKERDTGQNPRTRQLRELGVPDSALLFDASSKTSWQEAVDTLELMRSRRMSDALVVSDPPHLRRLNWTWGKVFAGTGLRYRLIAAPMKEWDADRWWGNKTSARFVVREYAKLCFYMVVH